MEDTELNLTESLSVAGLLEIREKCTTAQLPFISEMPSRLAWTLIVILSMINSIIFPQTLRNGTLFSKTGNSESYIKGKYTYNRVKIPI